MTYSLEQIKNFRFINGDIGWIDQDGKEVKAFKENGLTGETHQIKEGGELQYIYGMGFAIVDNGKYVRVKDYIADARQELIDIIEQEMTKYEDLRDNLIVDKANGNMAELCSLRDAFDETFDPFFDNKELRIKYFAWDKAQDCQNFDISNKDLEALLDCKDLKAYISYIREQFGVLEERGI